MFEFHQFVSKVKGVWMEYIKKPSLILAEELDTIRQSFVVFYLEYETAKFTIMKGKCVKQYDELRFLHIHLLINKDMECVFQYFICGGGIDWLERSCIQKTSKTYNWLNCSAEGKRIFFSLL